MDAFYAPKAYRAMPKSPAEYVAQIMRGLGHSGPAGLPAAAAALAQMGQVLFYPPNVAGWPGASHRHSHSSVSDSTRAVSWLPPSWPPANHTMSTGAPLRRIAW